MADLGSEIPSRHWPERPKILDYLVARVITATYMLATAVDANATSGRRAQVCPALAEARGEIDHAVARVSD